jgi:hypothetical protein
MFDVRDERPLGLVEEHRIDMAANVGQGEVLAAEGLEADHATNRNASHPSVRPARLCNA